MTFCIKTIACMLVSGFFAKETCNLKEPTNRSHPISDTFISITFISDVSHKNKAPLL